MATLIVDIETKAEDWKALPGITRSALTQWIEKADFSYEEKRKKLSTVQSRLSLSPFTASIISLAVYDVERKTGAVYFVSNESEDSFEIDDFTFKARTEKEILEDFWEGATSYDVFVTFNGRSFLMPFIHHRSVMQGVKPTVDIARQRYLTKQTLPYHVDLLDELSFYGGMSHRPSLALLCGAYGIDNSSLLSGDEIDAAFADERYRYIAEKNMGDVQAINGLYEKWKENLAPHSFINALEG
ncbi:MAG: ribonuclease H-like domain-containing protein [Candidatus Kaiserbacteria bacterium]|nr:ribonuclease H-like domain-containing protein [Candidatus Kaiserbacteria bacterium]MCB9815869.1 ribonuclease H-like domain-containing protein [Candidatus Nomurabacteria bacterium]